MKNMKSSVVYAMNLCVKSIQALVSNLRVLDSIQQIQNRNTALTSTFANLLDRPGTLRREPFRGSTRAASRIARGVAFAIGISLSIGASPADSAPIKTIDPKTYIRFTYNDKQALCLIRLYGKESAFNPLAVNGSHYGIPQGNSEWLKDQDGWTQVVWGLDYIGHRYGEPCIALDHWSKYGWH